MRLSCDRCGVYLEPEDLVYLQGDLRFCSARCMFAEVRERASADSVSWFTVLHKEGYRVERVELVCRDMAEDYRLQLWRDR